jgi:Xaa-Pro dipeptidase
VASRRNFLHAAGTAAAASLTSSLASRHTQAQEHASASPTAAALPPSIAALKSMKGQAAPITVEERRARIENARRAMAENRLDALMLTVARQWFTSRICAGAGRRTAVCPDPAGQRRAFLRLPGLRTRWRRGADRAGAARVRRRDPHLAGGRKPLRTRGPGLKDRGLASGRLGMEERVEFVFSDGVAKGAPALEIASGHPRDGGMPDAQERS